MEAGFVGVLVSEFASVLDGRGSEFVAIGATGSDLAAEQSDVGAAAELKAGFIGVLVVPVFCIVLAATFDVWGTLVAGVGTVGFSVVYFRRSLLLSSCLLLWTCLSSMIILLMRNTHNNTRKLAS